MNKKQLMIALILCGAMVQCQKDTVTGTGTNDKTGDTIKQVEMPALVKDLYHQSFNTNGVTLKNDTVRYDVDGDNNKDIAIVRHVDTIGDILQFSLLMFSIRDSMQFTYIREKPSMAMVDSGFVIGSVSGYQWVELVDASGKLPFTENSTSWSSYVFTHYIGFVIKKDVEYYGWLYLDNLAIKELVMNRTPLMDAVVGQSE